MFGLFTTHKKRVYLDHAGATPVSSRAKEALVQALSLFGNPSAIHQEGDVASHALQRARNGIGSVINAHSYEIIFTGTGTESCNLALLGTLEGARQQAGDIQQQTTDSRMEKNSTSDTRPHIIVSAIEHPAVLEPIKKLERDGQVAVSYLPVYENGIVKVSDVREALREETILVSVMYANNEIGTIQPVKDIGRMLDEWKREGGKTFTSYPYFHVDACQAGNYLTLDVLRLKCHLMTINSSKVYGPKGIAALYKREGTHLAPTILGGGQERGLRSGTESVSLGLSFACALKESHDMREAESVRLRALRDFFTDELTTQIPDVTVYGAWDEYRRQQTGDKRQEENPRGDGMRVMTNECRLPNNINIRVPGIPSDEMILRLDAKGFAVSHKSACASQETDGSYVVQALGATERESLENVRITLGRDTTKQDMERLISAIKEIKEKFGN
jgi:cysteine desulfurase